MKTVEVEITNKGAIYVDRTRITNRNTKWGNHTILDSFVCEKKEVVAECARRGHRRCLSNIDDDFYMAQM
jgi:hypothetical protein